MNLRAFPRGASYLPRTSSFCTSMLFCGQLVRGSLMNVRFYLLSRLTHVTCFVHLALNHTLHIHIVTLYSHGSRFIGIVLNERHVKLPPEALPLWRMMYRNGGLSELLFKQFVWPRFELVQMKKGHIIEEDSLFIVLDGVARATVHLKDDKGKEITHDITLVSGEVMNIKYLHLFRQAECEAFAEQTVRAECITDMNLV